MRGVAIATIFLCLAVVRTARGQTEWLVLFESCDIINTADSELILLAGTGDTFDMAIVTSRDTVLLDYIVDSDLLISEIVEVEIGGEVQADLVPAGSIELALDGDGLESVWWLTLNGRVVELDPFDLSPSDSGRFPNEFRDVPCDACPFVDFPASGACEDATENPLVPVILNLCGISSSMTLALMFAGLGALRFATRLSI